MEGEHRESSEEATVGGAGRGAVHGRGRGCQTRAALCRQGQRDLPGTQRGVREKEETAGFGPERWKDEAGIIQDGEDTENSRLREQPVMSGLAAWSRGRARTAGVLPCSLATVLSCVHPQAQIRQQYLKAPLGFHRGGKGVKPKAGALSHITMDPSLASSSLRLPSKFLLNHSSRHGSLMEYIFF